MCLNRCQQQQQQHNPTSNNRSQCFKSTTNDDFNTVMLSAEQVYLANKIEVTSLVVDTGSTYNLIGQHLLPVLNERLQAGGQNLKMEDTMKYFKFGGHDNTNCKSKVNIPINIAGTTSEIEVYIIPAKVPFLIEGQTLRSMEAKIDLAQNIMSINGHKAKMELTESGHMILPWTMDTHTTNKKTNPVLLTQKVSRKEYNQPEVMTAMIKEITNLNSNGTYIKVRQDPWLPVVDTM